MYRLVRRARDDQSGITGLETAIILIAFVMVASVFAYVVLSAGLFTSQKAKEAINAGLEEVQSTIELKGDIIARMENSVLTNVYLTIGAHPKSEPIDFTDTQEGKNKVIISYVDNFQQYPTLNWTLTKLVSNNATGDDNLLDDNELFQLDVNVKTVSDNASSEIAKLGPYHTFNLQIKPPKGAIVTIERTVPARETQIVNLR